MRLEDLLVMEVPSKQLRHVCAKYEIKPQGNSLADYAKAIASDDRAHDEGEALAEEFQYAGKTAVRIYKLLHNILDPPTYFDDINIFVGMLTNKYGRGINTTGIRLPPNDVPRLFKATKYNDKLFLSFTYLGTERRVFRNYEIVKERPQVVDYLVVHFNPFLIEFRVPNAKSTLFMGAFKEVLDLITDMSWVNMSELSNEEAQELRCILGGGLTCAKHKMTEGIYDTIEVKAKPDINLADESAYQESYSSKPYNSLTFRFPFRYNSGLEDDISIKVTQNGFNFSTSVSEEVIAYVVDYVLAIKINTINRIVSDVAEAVASS